MTERLNWTELKRKYPQMLCLSQLEVYYSNIRWAKKLLQFFVCCVLSSSVVSNSLRPRDYSPPGSSVLGDSPSNSTGMGCHTLFQGISPTQGSNPGLPHCRWILYHLSHHEAQEYWSGSVLCLVIQLCPTLCDTMDCSLQGFPAHGDSPGKNNGVGRLSLLQGIFPTQGSNPGLQHYRWILYHLSIQPNFPTQESNWGLLHCRQILKNKKYFHFHQELYWTYSPFCSITFCYFLGNFIIPPSLNFLSFWAKNCSRCLLQSSRGLKFFLLREFCKVRNKWKSKGAMSGEYDRWIRTSQPSCNSFCLVIKETCSLAVCWRKIMQFLLTNSRCFLSSAFSCSKRKQYLLELIGWRPTKPLVFNSLALWSLFVPTLLYSIHFSLPITACYKNGTFHYISVEKHVWKHGQEGFYSLMWNPNTKVITITKQV